MSAEQRRNKGKWIFKDIAPKDLAALVIGPITAVMQNGCTSAETSTDTDKGTFKARAYFNHNGYLAIELQGIRPGEDQMEKS
jgi:hypothetical protein